MRSTEEQAETNCIVKVLSGSHAYGMATTTSDVDIRGIFCADKLNVICPWFQIGESIDMDGKDNVIYELRKYMTLYLQQNPNILEILWVDYSDILFNSTEYGMLRAARSDFLTSQIAFKFVGYAEEQLRRIKGHSKWLTQGEKGIYKLRELYRSGNIDLPWLEKNFDESIIQQVIK